MKRRHLLFAGLILVAVSAFGPAVQGSAGSRSVRFGQHMAGYGHMGWSDNTPNSQSTINGAREIVVTSTEFGFSPSAITGTVGESINIVLVNDGSVTHDWSIPELGVRIVANPGQQATAGFTLDAAGSYQALCSIPGHAKAGMIGTVEVTG
ncbi:MAG: cupredoxin domain-containing protein [Acidimicrobiia bacterium]|nr:cupredoxin domain-containing protein [Acidimicrobiia bacterium]